MPDYFTIIFINEFKQDPTTMDNIEKCVYNKILMKTQSILLNRHYLKHLGIKQSNETYNKFFEIFTKLYDKYFPIGKIKMKPERVLSSWITNGIVKPSKQKQKLYEKKKALYFKAPYTYQWSKLSSSGCNKSYFIHVRHLTQSFKITYLKF